MKLYAFGLNHRAAPLDLRERLAVPAARLPEALAALRAECAAEESVLLSTCNRVEVYALGNGTPIEGDRLARSLGRLTGVEPGAFAALLYRHEGEAAVRHLFRVAAGLDSLVIGETQILGQVKLAYEAARAAAATGPVLNPLFQRALGVAKSLHERTGLGRRKVSVPSVAVEFLEKVFTEPASKTLMVIGTGEVGGALLAHLLDRGMRRVILAGRSAEKAAALAAEQAPGTRAIGLEQVAEELAGADVVVTCAASPTHLVTRALVAEALRRRRGRPMFCLDLAVPRNIEPGVGALDNVYLYNVDDLEAIVRANLAEREREAERCDAEVAAAARVYAAGLSLRDTTQVIARLNEELHGIGKAELARTLERLPGLPAEARAEVEQLVHRVVNKILHPPIAALKEAAGAGGGAEANRDLPATVKRIFRLRL